MITTPDLKAAAWLIDSYDRKDKLKQRVELSPLTSHLDESAEAYPLCRIDEAQTVITALLERLQVAEDAAKEAINIITAVNDQLSRAGFSQHIVREGNKDIWRYVGNGEVIANRVRDFAARRLTP